MNTEQAMDRLGFVYHSHEWATPRWHRVTAMCRVIKERRGSYRAAAIEAGESCWSGLDPLSVERVYEHVTGLHTPRDHGLVRVLCPATALVLVAGTDETARLLGVSRSAVGALTLGRRARVQAIAEEALQEVVSDLMERVSLRPDRDLDEIARLRLISACARGTGISRDAVARVIDGRTEAGDPRTQLVTDWAHDEIEARILAALLVLGHAGVA